MVESPRLSTSFDLSRTVLGGIPTKAIDILICAVLVVLSEPRGDAHEHLPVQSRPMTHLQAERAVLRPFVWHGS